MDRTYQVRFRGLKVIAAIFGVFFLAELTFAQTKTSDLRQLLATQGFSGYTKAKDGAVFTELGHMACGSKPLRVVLYDWTDPHPIGEFPHGAYRIIFIDKDVYLGSYLVDDKPSKIGKDFILFPNRADWGNRFVCEMGELPKKTWLNGDNPELRK